MYLYFTLAKSAVQKHCDGNRPCADHVNKKALNWMASLQ